MNFSDFHSNSVLFNPDLPTISSPSLREWRGTPLTKRGRFVNLDEPFNPSFGKLLRWQTSPNPDKSEKKHDSFRVRVEHGGAFLAQQDDCLVWLGHATFFLRLEGKTLLIDPVLGNVGAFVKRLSPLPIDARQLVNIDYLLLSHDHRDHADEASIKRISAQNPNMRFLTGLRCDSLLQSWTKSTKIQAAGWYQQFQTDDIEVYYLPSRHWGRRLLSDTNLRLWGAFLIRTPKTTIYFSGDSGYGTHFSHVRELFGNIDYCIIGVGAYKPEWFMGAAHISPTDAVKAVHEMQAKVMIPMHFGTFDLSDEAIGDPVRVLQGLNHDKKISATLVLPAIGEHIKIH